MNSRRNPSAARAIWIIGCLALRRQLNFLTSVGFLRRWRAKSEGKRSGTPTKFSGRPILAAVVFALMIVNGVVIAGSGLSGLSAASQDTTHPAGKILVNSYTYAQLVRISNELNALKRDHNSAERKKFEGLWNHYLGEVLSLEVHEEPLTHQQEQASLRRMRKVFLEKGAAGFAPDSEMDFMVSGTAWPRSGPARSSFTASLGILLLLWMPTIVFMSLATNNKDLGEVSWSLEWLYTFPTSVRAIFASRLVAYSFLNWLVGCFLLPFVILVYIAGGLGIAALPVGLVATAYLALVAGSITTLLEVALRKYMNPARLKNFQALFTVFGTICLLLFYASTFSAPIEEFLIHRAASMGSLWVWNPVSVPLILGLPGATRWQVMASLLEMIVVSYGAISLALAGSEWLTRDGLIRAGGPYQGVRAKSIAGSRDGRLRGIAAVEVHLLSRDRNLLVQVIFIPLLVPAYYLLVAPRMFIAVLGSLSHAALVVFAVGAYSFMSSAVPILDRERKTLWHLLSLPDSLVSIFLRKTVFWAVIGLLYGGVVLALIIHFGSGLHASSFGDIFLALYGIALYAFIAAGLGILTTDVMEVERHGRLKVSTVYLYMILAAMYANIFYAPSFWTKLAQFVLSTLLAFALWQKVKDVCPYLLDPTDQPPPTISLADGMIAALAFFVVQDVAFVILQHTSPIELTTQVTIAYVFAGLIVACAVLFIFWRQGIPALWEKIGLLPRDEKGNRIPAMQAVVQGITWGAIAAVAAVVYLRVLSLFPQWELWKQDAQLRSFLAPGSQPFWICVLAVVAAPLFEEFLFRGLIFQGLRRSTGPIIAIVGSAALFALVHPPIAVIPVFGLGIAAAISFDNSKFLLAPILAHAVYNGSLLFLNRM